MTKMNKINMDDFIRFHYGTFEKMCEYYAEHYPSTLYEDDDFRASILCDWDDRAGYPILEFYLQVDYCSDTTIISLLKASDKGEVMRNSLREILEYAPFVLNNIDRDSHMRSCISKRRNLFNFILSPSALLDRVDFLEQVCRANDYPYLGASFMSVLYKKVYRKVAYDWQSV